ncbi:MAG: right-handed parallel beta-helix repeat-containing protein [Calditrichaceae bacterium]|nr:right-handed parallel beta-helix repeat-containing protein [Calditrichaceae bacterium]RQV92951.1 MAG: T9SS C-terminal target domain-containing protein [Calditrichota bacterium]
MKTKFQFLVILSFLLFSLQNLLCQNSMVPGELKTYCTINSIGIEWPIGGDDNHNAECTVNYRISGGGQYKQALPLYRIDFNGSNMLAGSILFLEENTSYEVELDLHDPDGGSSIQNFTITTRSIPQKPESGNTYYVSPGNGGGTGTESDPFLGVETAQNEAAPGDVFIMNTGNYGGRLEFTASGAADNYIVWKAAKNAAPQFEGIRIIGDYIWIEGITIEDQEYGLLTQSGKNPTGIVIKGNYFKNCFYSINLNHGGENWYITDNIIEGDISDFTSGEFSGEGVELQHSNGHVVAYNKIFNTADGVSYPGENCDIFRNEIYNVSDDGIEFDFGYANNRAWENRITNANNNGISFQPMNSAPAYVIRNQVIVIEEDVLKLRDAVDRVLFANNTCVCQNGPVNVDTHFLTGFHSNNNLYISVNDAYAWEDCSSSTETDWRTNLDYDGFDWNDNYYAFKWAGNRLQTLEELQTNYQIELNGLRVKKDDLFNEYDFPASPTPAPLQYLTLTDSCNAIDAGIALNNINENYLGKAPDLGAFEAGQELPVYGPRENTAVHIQESISIPDRIVLFQNYPNPFNPVTNIEFQIMNYEFVTLKIFDISGKKIATLINEKLPIGRHKIIFDGSGLSTGIYFYSLQSRSGFTKTGKMILIK